MHPWNHWYHCMGHTYGTWLPGDPKGFRTRHHREHIIGDYKNPPPPGLYERRHEKAKALMKRDPVFLDMEQRRRALEHFVVRETREEVEMDSVNRRVTPSARLSGRNRIDPRKWIGIAKRVLALLQGRRTRAGRWAVGDWNRVQTDRG